MYADTHRDPDDPEEIDLGDYEISISQAVLYLAERYINSEDALDGTVESDGEPSADEGGRELAHVCTHAAEGEANARLSGRPARRSLRPPAGP